MKAEPYVIAVPAVTFEPFRLSIVVPDFGAVLVMIGPFTGGDVVSTVVSAVGSDVVSTVVSTVALSVVSTVVSVVVVSVVVVSIVLVSVVVVSVVASVPFALTGITRLHTSAAVSQKAAKRFFLTFISFSIPSLSFHRNPKDIDQMAQAIPNCS